MRGIEGKVAFVTGAACPPEIGRAVARLLAAAGADVACVDRIEVPGEGEVGGLPDSACATAEQLEAVAAEVRSHDRRAVVIDADVADRAEVDAAVARTVAEFGRIDLAVNVQGGLGAGLGWAPLVDLEPASWERSLDVNLTGAFHVTQACARQMLAQGGGGSIVLLSSFASLAAQSGTGAFAAAKAGVDRLAGAFARELGPAGIRVNTVRPLGVDPSAATTENPFLQRTIGDGPAPDRLAWARDHIALERFQHPEETAAVILFLLSDDASFVTGEAVTVSGGGRM
jgi:NAD(P)-dependent dehydrogenase (short-subunit alcohol dehydrogenase family)